MANAILNFHFDYLTTSLMETAAEKIKIVKPGDNVMVPVYDMN